MCVRRDANTAVIDVLHAVRRVQKHAKQRLNSSVEVQRLLSNSPPETCRRFRASVGTAAVRLLKNETGEF
jgi:hypothetical protein